GLAGDSRVWRIAVSPQGGKLIAFTGQNGSSTGFYVELPKDLPPVKTVVVKAPAPDPIKGKDVPKGLDPLALVDGGATIRKFNNVFQEPLWSRDGKTFFMSQAGQGFLEVDSRDFSIKKKNLALADNKGVFFKGQMAWSAEGLLTVGFDGNP